jgi:hypothetical protein
MRTWARDMAEADTRPTPDQQREAWRQVIDGLEADVRAYLATGTPPAFLGAAP